MTVTDIFTENAQRILENRVFKPLKSKGMHNLAIDSYNDLKDRFKLPDSDIIKNAYLLNFTHETADPRNDTLQPDEIEAKVTNINRHAITTLKTSIPEYLEKHSLSADISDKLYATLLTIPTLEGEIKKKDYIKLIGSEAFNLATQTKYLWENPDYFNDKNITVEAQALYLVKLDEFLHIMTTDLHEKYVPSKFIDKSIIDDAEQLLNHINNVNQDSDQTFVECNIINNYNRIKPILNNTNENSQTIKSNNDSTVVSFPSLGND